MLAMEVFTGAVFTSMQIDDAKLLGLVFMPLMFMSKDDMEDLQELGIVMFYEKLSAVLPRGINGHPTFWSCEVLDEDDYVRFCAFFDDLKDEFGSGESVL